VLLELSTWMKDPPQQLQRLAESLEDAIHRVSGGNFQDYLKALDHKVLEIQRARAKHEQEGLSGAAAAQRLLSAQSQSSPAIAAVVKPLNQKRKPSVDAKKNLIDPKRIKTSKNARETILSAAQLVKQVLASEQSAAALNPIHKLFFESFLAESAQLVSFGFGIDIQSV